MTHISCRPKGPHQIDPFNVYIFGEANQILLKSKKLSWNKVLAKKLNFFTSVVEVRRYMQLKTTIAGYPKRAPRSDAEDLPSSRSLRLEKMGESGTHAGGH